MERAGETRWREHPPHYGDGYPPRVEDGLEDGFPASAAEEETAAASMGVLMWMDGKAAACACIPSRISHRADAAQVAHSLCGGRDMARLLLVPLHSLTVAVAHHRRGHHSTGATAAQHCSANNDTHDDS